jgi:signal transduction histidine kinase
MHETPRPRGSDAVSAMTAGPGREPRAGRTADSAEITRRLMADRDRIGSEINDVVVRRLFSAGLSLQNALGLMDGHHAAKHVQEAITDLDQAIINLRNTVFGMRSTDSPNGGTPG